MENFTVTEVTDEQGRKGILVEPKEESNELTFIDKVDGNGEVVRTYTKLLLIV